MARLKPYKITYAIVVGLVPEPALRISSKRIFQAEDVDRLAAHFGIVRVVPAKTPIAFIAPLTLRIDQGTNSARWRWLRDCCPPITSVISLPYDVFKGVKVHTEVLLFNMPKLKPHYFLPDQYLG